MVGASVNPFAGQEPRSDGASAMPSIIEALPVQKVLDICKGAIQQLASSEEADEESFIKESRTLYEAEKLETLLQQLESVLVKRRSTALSSLFRVSWNTELGVHVEQRDVRGDRVQRRIPLGDHVSPFLPF